MWARRIFFAFSTALARAVVRERAAALVVEATSATLIALGSPAPEAQKPKAATLLPGAIDAAQLGAATATTLPLRVAVPLQLSVILTLLGTVKVSFQFVDDLPPELAILKLR